MRWLIVAGIGGVLLVGAGSAAAFGNEAGSANRGTTSVLIEGTAPIIDEVSFVGLRHLSQDAVRAQISSRAGARLDEPHGSQGSSQGLSHHDPGGPREAHPGL